MYDAWKEILKALDDYDLTGMGCRRFINQCKKEYRVNAPGNWNEIEKDFNCACMEPDRLINCEKILKCKQYSGKVIVLLTVSAGCALDTEKDDGKEQGLLKTLGCQNRCEHTRKFLETYQPGAVIWDEFHRYATKLKSEDGTKPVSAFFDWEKESWEKDKTDNGQPITTKMRFIFISATPFQTNISGKENQKVMELLYHNAMTEGDSMEKLPSFEEFAKLFCGGNTKADYTKQLINLYNKYVEATSKASKEDLSKHRDKLEVVLRQRMIRHERTQLQKEPEKHIRLYKPEELDAAHYGEVLKNTMEQCQCLKDAGFSEGALKWSITMPWILSFSRDRGSATKWDSNIQKPVTTSYSCLDVADKDLKNREELFAYDKNGAYIQEKLKLLPNQSLPFRELCEQNLADQMSQLLWVPPTARLYQPGENSIFEKYRDYSKTLVFAEFHYQQKGGARLLSDYAKLRNVTDKEQVPEKFPPELKYAEKVNEPGALPFDLTAENYQGKTLDDIVGLIQQNTGIDKEYALMWIASPAVCAKLLSEEEGIDEIEIEAAFNRYFRQDGVREALWSWICNNKYSAGNCSDEKEREKWWREGILRYCAEGNLYAVLEEWIFVLRRKDDCNLTDQLCEVICPGSSNSDGGSNDKVQRGSIVHVQSKDSLVNNEDGCKGMCSFADRLTGDVNDVGSGEDEDAETAAADRFSSPFWPMVMFAGRGAQEGMDFHQYCLRIMHMTIPKGAVSFDQRNGRIDRFRSLLVRRRAAEKLPMDKFIKAGMNAESGMTTKDLMRKIFAYLIGENVKSKKEDALYPNWHIMSADTRYHFEQIFPVWECSIEHAALISCDAMLKSYRGIMGTTGDDKEGYINLQAEERRNP